MLVVKYLKIVSHALNVFPGKKHRCAHTHNQRSVTHLL